MNDKYVLPQAAQDTLGGIKAAAVQDKYTQECRIDKETGKLYTRSADRFLIEDTFEGNPVMSSSCREGNISLIEGYGESTQATTTGKNVIPTFFDAWESGDYDATTGEKTKDSSRVRTKDLYPVDFRSAFAFSSDITFRIFCRGYDESGMFQKNIGELTYTGQKHIPAYVKKLGFVLIKESNTTFSEWQEIFNNLKMMVCDGTLSTEYEPYTGGQPSPSPEYPQEIKSPVVTAVKVTGKNLFDISKVIPRDAISVQDDTIFVRKDNLYGAMAGTPNLFKDYFPNAKIGQKYTLSFEYKNRDFITVYGYGTMITNNTYTVTEEMLKGIVFFYSGASEDNFYKNIQFEPGTTATSYEPYKEQSITFSAPITLRGIPSESGNITIDGTKYLSDYIGQKEGVYGVFRSFFVYEVTGNEDFGCFGGTFVEEGSFDAYLNIRKYVSEAKIDTAGYVKWGLCNNLIFNSNSWTKKGEIGFCYNYGQLHIRVKNETISATQEMEISQKTQLLKNYLKNLYDSGTPMIFLYPLTTESFEPLPEPDQQALKGLKTFYPTSIITLETEDGAGVWGKAILKQDMKLYIQNKIKELSNNSVKQIQNINRALLE